MWLARPHAWPFFLLAMRAVPCAHCPTHSRDIRYLGAESQSALAKCLKKNKTLKRLSLASELVEAKTKAALSLTLAWVTTRGSDDGLEAVDLDEY